jgi:hypothetical protein
MMPLGHLGKVSPTAAAATQHSAKIKYLVHINNFQQSLYV